MYLQFRRLNFCFPGCNPDDDYSGPHAAAGTSESTEVGQVLSAVVLTAGLSSAANKPSIIFVQNVVIIAAFGDVLIIPEGRSTTVGLDCCFFFFPLLGSVTLQCGSHSETEGLKELNG